MSQDSPEGTTFAQVVEAELKAAGMDVTTTVLSAASGDIVNRVLVQKDYDATTWAYGVLDDFPSLYLQLVGTFNSANPSYR